MIEYLLAGLVLGSIYAIAASGAVITFRTAGVLNFAFGAEAYFIGRFYYFLTVQHNWSSIPAALLTLLALSPLLGLVLWALLFRSVGTQSHVIKMVVTIGLSVALPALSQIIFGTGATASAQGLASPTAIAFHLGGVPVTAEQLAAYAVLVFVLILGVLALRYTAVGLDVRAIIDSEAMARLSGIKVSRVNAGVWAVSTMLAGVAGILGGPVINLDPASFALLTIAAFAAMIAGRMQLGPSVAMGILMGLVTSVVQRYAPSSSSWAAGIVSSIPFAFVFVFLLVDPLLRGRALSMFSAGTALDAAIAPRAEVRRAHASAEPRSGIGRRGGIWLVRLAALALVIVIPQVAPSFWVGLFAQGLGLAIVMLSISLLSGDAGMIWLCQITLAGVGAVVTAQLATVYQWPLLAALIAAGVVAVPIGLIIGLLTIRLGTLYVALATLCFGLLMDNLVFRVNRFYNFGAGVAIIPPRYMLSGAGFAYTATVVFAIFAAVAWRLRHSTIGLALSSVRSSEIASRTIGIGIVRVKLGAAAVAAFMAAVGGGLLAVYAQSATPSSFDTLTGLVWFAVLVTVGLRSIGAALMAGMAMSLLPGIFVAYLPTSLGEVPAALFGLGAILAARSPDGALAAQRQQIEQVAGFLRARIGRQPGRPDPPSCPPTAGTAPQAAAASVREQRP
jgi:branched-chain amino acid transport system permease protein